MRALLAMAAVAACAAPSDSALPSDDSDDPPDAPPEDAQLADLPIIADAPDIDPDPNVVRVQLTAARHMFMIGDDEVSGYAYNGQVPGPTIRAKRGDRVVVDITNELEEATTVHWHGLFVPYEMDGITWTEDPIAPGETFTVSFTLEQAGTYWYHPHIDTERQVDLGLYGAFVAEDPDAPTVDRDLVVVADSWGEEGSRTPETGADHHGLDAANIEWTLNGALNPRLVSDSGERVRIRWLNASNTGYLDLEGTTGASWIAGDTGIWAARSTERQILSPGDRADAVVRLGSSDERIDIHAYSLYGGSVQLPGPAASLVVQPQGTSAAPDPLEWGFDGAAPTADPGRTDVRLVLQGDATQDAWMMNGETFPDVSVPVLARDEEVILEVRNISPTEHPFHVHGHEFEVLSVDGVPPATRQVEDTINIRIRETVRLRMIPDNPGFWMAHCHILPHAEGGMMTVLQVD